MDYPSESRRGSRNRAFDRSLSYSEAIGYESCRSSIEIPNISNTEVYNNEELKNRYRISQTYVEGKEIIFPLAVNNINAADLRNDQERYPEVFDDNMYLSSEDTDDEHAAKGLVMKIDVENNENPKLSTPTIRLTSNGSTQPTVGSSLPTEDLDSIEIDNSSMYQTIPDGHMSIAHGYSTPYSRRKKNGKQ